MSSIGGKNYKKCKKEPKLEESAKYDVTKEDYPDCIYAKVTSMLGSGRLMALGEDKINYNCVIRGRLYKKVWIKKEDYLIIFPRREEKNNTADVVHKLSNEEISKSNVIKIFIALEESNDKNNNSYSNGGNLILDDSQDFEFDTL
jgi:initiation factor 1A